MFFSSGYSSMEDEGEDSDEDNTKQNEPASNKFKSLSSEEVEIFLNEIESRPTPAAAMPSFKVCLTPYEIVFYYF